MRRLIGALQACPEWCGIPCDRRQLCRDIGDTERRGAPMGVGRYLVKAHLGEGRPVAELAAVHGVHRR